MKILLALLLLSSPLGAQAYCYGLDNVTIATSPTLVGTAVVEYGLVEASGTPGVEVRGFSAFVTWPETAGLSIIDTQITSAADALNGGNGADFFDCDVNNGPDFIGAFCGVVFDFQSQETLTFDTYTPMIAYTFAASGQFIGDVTLVAEPSPPISSWPIPVFNEVITAASGDLLTGGPFLGFEGVVSISAGELWLYGDPNLSGTYSIGDAITTLAILFQGVTAQCFAASDVNNSGTVTIDDAIIELTWLFQTGAPSVFEPFVCEPRVDPLGCTTGLVACP